MSRLWPAVLVLFAVLLLGGCSSLDTAAEDVAQDAAPADEPAPAAEPQQADADGADRDPAVDEGEPGGEGALPLPARAARTPERVIKEGTVTLEVDEGQFMPTYERVVEAARNQGGAVSASKSTTDDRGLTTGSVTVRVPVERYEDLLIAVNRVAQPVAQDIRTEEVTGQVIDLQSRLRHLRAQEAFYLGLLDDAADVQDAIAVQRQVDDIQARIEQLQGRLDHLEDRADFSTLTVEIVEAGADPSFVLPSDDEPDLAVYWQHARHGFVTIIGWALVASVTLAPLALPLLLAYLAWRAAARRRPQAPATVAADAE